MKISEMNKITRHYDKYFQQTDAIVIHPNFEAKLHVDALLYQPTKTFPFWKLATMGRATTLCSADTHWETETNTCCL